MSTALLDILPPAPPPEPFPTAAVLLSLLLLVGLATLARRLYHAPRRRAHRQLCRLRASVRTGRLGGREAAHALAEVLALGLGAQWGRETDAMDLAARLAAARFAPESCSRAELDGMLAEAAERLGARP